MKLHKRLGLLIKYTQFTVFAFISLVYGIFFGGMTSLGSLSGGESVTVRFILSALASGGAYFIIFTFAMVAVFILGNAKLFMSFNMSLKMIRQLWMDLIVLITVINGIVLGLILFLMVKESSYTIRVMDMDLTQMNLHNWVFLFGLIVITTLFLSQLMSLICNVANRHGIFFAFGTLALVGVVVVIAFQRILHMIQWGEHLVLFAVVVTIITAIGFFINFKMIQKTEVTR